ncbi:MAG: right-handed parallel beta-helix repeat-containing protein [Thermomicrobiales bacterium]
MDYTAFDELARNASTALRRRSVLGLLAGVALGAGLTAGADAAQDDVDAEHRRRRRKRRKEYCLNGKTVTAKSPRKKRRLRRKGATNGACTCTPNCPAGSCFGNDGCGGQCPGCSSGSVCVNGTCETCDVTCSGNPATCGTALTTALASGGKIRVCPGRYSGAFTINQNTQLYGAGGGSGDSTNTVIEASGMVSVFTLGAAPTVTFSRLRMTGGVASAAGGGIDGSAGGAITVADCVIDNNKAPIGAGIYATGPLTMTGSTVSNNIASGSSGGGLQLVGAGVNHTIANSTISANSVTGGTPQGGGIFVEDANLAITGTTITTNTAAAGAGIRAILLAGSAQTMDSSSKVTNNTGTGIEGSGAANFVVNGGSVSGNSGTNCSGNVSGC